MTNKIISLIIRLKQESYEKDIDWKGKGAKRDKVMTEREKGNET